MSPHEDHQMPVDADSSPPTELREIAGALDTLGRRERDRPGSGFEDRLFAASIPALKAGGASEEGRGVLARIGPDRWRGLRLAAAVALAVGAGLLAMRWGGSATRPSGPVAVAPGASGIDVQAIEAELEAFLSDSAEWKVGLALADDAPSGENGDSFWEIGSTDTEESM